MASLAASVDEQKSEEAIKVWILQQYFYSLLTFITYLSSFGPQSSFGHLHCVLGIEKNQFESLESFKKKIWNLWIRLEIPIQRNKFS